jgi:hypothetical protein
VNIIIEPRQLKIFAVLCVLLCVLGVFSLIGGTLRDEPSAPKAPAQSMEECMRAMYALAERAGMVALNGRNQTMSDIKERVCAR